MRVTLVAPDDDSDEVDVLGSFVLRDGVVTIDAPEEGRWMFEETLGETLLALNEDFEVGEPVTSTSDPEGWMRGLLLQYNSAKLRAELDDEEDD